jgi:hypothetical protein
MDSPFVCDIAALTPEQRDRHRELAERLRPVVLKFVEQADGYAAQFESRSGRLVELAEFMELEGLCCPFFKLGVTAEKKRGDLTLTVTGPDGVKPFIRAEFGIPEA